MADTIHRTTVAEYLAAGGLGPDWRYASVFGRTAAQIYRRTFRREPERTKQLINGEVRPVMAYRPSELRVLDATWLACPHTAHLPVPTLEPAMTIAFTAALHGEPVEMANANAAVVLDVLGIDEPCGEEDADAFLGRVLVALAVAPEDEGRPAVANGNHTDFGRPAGYLHRRLRDLHGLAEYARADGLDITWG